VQQSALSLKKPGMAQRAVLPQHNLEVIGSSQLARLPAHASNWHVEARSKGQAIRQNNEKSMRTPNIHPGAASRLNAGGRQTSFFARLPFNNTKRNTVVFHMAISRV